MIETVNSKLTAINDVIRDLSGTTDKMGLDDMLTALNAVSDSGSGSEDSYDAGYEAGQQDENDRFWHTIQTNLNWVGGTTGWEEVRRVDYSYAFKNWRTATEINPKYPLENLTTIANMFDNCGNLMYHPPFTMAKANTGYAMFNSCRELREVNADIRLKGTCSAMFNFCPKLTKINKLIIEGTCTWAANSFYYCTKLIELYIEGTIDTAFYLNDCESLNKASLTNVMNILSTTTSGLTCTLSKTAVDKAFETSEGANDGSTSTEWTTLVNSKSNWTISLV